MLEQVLERIAAALEKSNELREKSFTMIGCTGEDNLQPLSAADRMAETTERIANEGEPPKRRRRTKAEIEAAEQNPATPEPTPEPAAEEVAVEQQGESAAIVTEAVVSEHSASPLDATTAEPEIVSTEHTTTAVTWEDALAAIKAVNDAPNGGRQGVIKIMVQFGVTPADVDPRNNGKVPDLQRTGKFAEIKAFAESLLTAKGRRSQSDLGI